MKIELPCLLQKQDYSCVPACIRIVLRAFGVDLSETEIGRVCKTTPRGTDQDGAIAGIALLGFKAIKLEETSFEEMAQYLQQGHPVITFLSVKHLPYGKGQAGMHAVVVNGFKMDSVFYIDPARCEEIEVNKDTFIAAWDECGRLGLVIEP